MAVRYLAVKRPSVDPLATLALLDASDNSVVLRKSGMFFVRELGFNRWETLGQQLLSVAESTTWWIADWIVYGEETFQDRYREAVQRTSLNYQTLRNYVWVARRFDLARRRDNLSFGHHAEVAALDQPEQDYWLRKAEELTWSRNQLRNEVRTSLRLRQADSHVSSAADEAPDRAAADGAADEGESAVAPGQAQAYDADHVLKIVSLHVTDRQLAQFTVAARSQNQDVEEWALKALEDLSRLSQ